MDRRDSPPTPRRWAEIAAIAACYVASGKLGFLMAIPPGNVTVVWAPSGIALAAALLIGGRAAPGVALGAFLVNAWFFQSLGQSLSPAALSVCAAISAGSTLQALAGASLVERLTDSRDPFERPREVLAFAGAAVIACLAAASFGVTSLCLGGFARWADFVYTWGTWYLGDLAGAILVTPLVLILRKPGGVNWNVRRAAEAALLLAFLAAAATEVFWRKSPSMFFHFPYALLPFLIWSALRFERWGAALSILAVSAIAIGGTVKGMGAFRGGPLNESLILLQSFLAVYALTGLVLGAAISGYKRSEEELRRSHGTLERRVADRTAELAQANALLKSESAKRQRSEQRFRLLVDSVQDYAIMMLDPQGHVATWNQGAERIKGYRVEEILGRHFSRFYPEEDLRDGKPRRLLQAAARDGRLEDIGWRLRKDGSRYWANVTITALKDESGGLVGFATVTRDLTERKLAEEALQRKTEELARSNVELELFASTASHDLQEPLRKIIIFGDLLKKRAGAALDATSLDWLGRMQNASERMTKLIQDLLVLARVTRDTRPLELVDLNAVVRDVLRDLEIRAATADAKIEVGKLPALRAHPMQMRQLFQNLIGNAIKFRKKTEPARVVISSPAPAGGFARIVVADNGIGFSEKDAERIFEPFTRLNARAEYEGNGMGLAICRKIMLRHGGWISAQSGSGKGAAFVVELPFKEIP